MPGTAAWLHAPDIGVDLRTQRRVVGIRDWRLVRDVDDSDETYRTGDAKIDEEPKRDVEFDDTPDDATRWEAPFEILDGRSRLQACSALELLLVVRGRRIIHGDGDFSYTPVA
jgi:hypothetical protein